MAPRRDRRILLVSHAFAPDSRAGVEVYTARLGAGLRDRGWAVAVACGRVRPGRGQYEVLREQVEGLPVFGLVQNYPYRDLPEAVADPALDRAFRAVVEDFRPSVVAFQSFQGLSLGMIDEARRAGASVVLHLHDGYPACPSGGQRMRGDGALCGPVDRTLCGACFDRHRHREGPLERGGRWLAARLPGPPDLLHRGFQALPGGARELVRRANERLAARGERPEPPGAGAGAEPGADPRIEARHRAFGAALSSADLLVTPSRFLARSLAEDGLPTAGAVHVPTGVPAGAPRRAGSAALRLAFVGTWVPHKGPQVVGEALAALDPGLEVEAVAVGPAPFPAFKASVLAAAGGRLADGGVLDPEGVRALLAEVDAVLIPSLWAENAPLVALEARAAGTPALASAIGGLPELVEDGIDGLLLAPGEAGAWRNAIERLARSPERRAALAASVRPPRGVEAWVEDLAGRYGGLA